VLEAVVFTLIGLQLTEVAEAGGGQAVPLVIAGLVVTAAAVAARVIWVFPVSYLQRALIPALRRREPDASWKAPAVISWAGMRGVVSLAAAFAIPETVPGRDVVVFLAFFVTVATLALHGLTLPWLIRKLGVQGGESQADALAEAQAQHAAARAAMARLDELTDNGTAEPRSVVKLKKMAELRANSAWERLGRDVSETGEGPGATYRRLRREMVTAERDTFVVARNEGRIDDEVLRRVQRELDLEEAMLSRED